MGAETIRLVKKGRCESGVQRGCSVYLYAIKLYTTPGKKSTKIRAFGAL